MIMKLRNIIYSVVAVSTLALTSCSDSYLDEKMYSSYGTDVTDVEAKVIGLHQASGRMVLTWVTLAIPKV